MDQRKINETNQKILQEKYTYFHELTTHLAKNNNTVLYNLPVKLDEDLDTILCVVEFWNKYPEIMRDNVAIECVYGNFPNMLWNGGRPLKGMTYTQNEIEAIINLYNSAGIAINFTCTNHLVTEFDLLDKYSNMIISLGNNGKNAITVGSPLLYSYLKEHYPNYKYYKSIVPTEDKDQFIFDDTADVNLMKRNFNNNFEYLDTIPIEQRDRIEFLANDVCTPFCKRICHYNHENACFLKYQDEMVEPGLYNYCSVDHDFMHFNTIRWPITILPDQIYGWYKEHGYRRYKLSSRGDSTLVQVSKIAEYMVKPEYQVDFLWNVAQHAPMFTGNTKLNTITI